MSRTRNNKEINAKTDISFSFRPIKEPRRIVAVEFYDIQRKTSIIPAILSLIPGKYRENKEVLQNIQKYLELHGPECVTGKINCAVSRNPQNFADYLHSALANNHGEGFASAQVANPEAGRFEPGTIFEFGGRRYTFDVNGLKISDAKILTPKEMAHAIKAGLLIPVSPESLGKERREAQLAEYEKYRQETIDAHLASPSISERQAAEESFIQKLDAFPGDIFKEKGWDNPVITSLWRIFMAGRIKKLLSFQEFGVSSRNGKRLTQRRLMSI
jgi:hypothetical protein